MSFYRFSRRACKTTLSTKPRQKIPVGHVDPEHVVGINITVFPRRAIMLRVFDACSQIILHHTTVP